MVAKSLPFLKVLQGRVLKSLRAPQHHTFKHPQRHSTQPSRLPINAIRRAPSLIEYGKQIILSHLTDGFTSETSQNIANNIRPRRRANYSKSHTCSSARW